MDEPCAHRCQEPGDRRLRILIADDHDLVRCGLRFLLESRPGWNVCAEARTGKKQSRRQKN